MNFTKEQLRLYLVTDRRYLEGRNLIDVVMQSIEGGVTMVQLREKDITAREFIELAHALKTKLSLYNKNHSLHIPLIINDRIDIALAVDADGVHIGQSDMPYEEARRLLGYDKIVGLSVENLSDVIEANAVDVDYIGISPVFATPTKTDTALPFGLDGLRSAVNTSIHPTVAIGGINMSNAHEVMQTGADGIAVVSAILASTNPTEATKQLLIKRS